MGEFCPMYGDNCMGNSCKFWRNEEGECTFVLSETKTSEQQTKKRCPTCRAELVEVDFKKRRCVGCGQRLKVR